MKQNIIAIIYLVFIILIPTTFSFAFKLPDTGQNKCYDNEKEIPCPKPGEDFYGQDGNYSINSPPSFTKLDESGNDLPDSASHWIMVRDNNTGLIWEVKQAKDGKFDYLNLHDADNQYIWYDSNPDTNGGYSGDSSSTSTENFIKSINKLTFGGYTDWRIPTIEELISIIDYGQDRPAINQNYFPHTMIGLYWSSMTHRLNTYARGVSFFHGAHSGSSKLLPRYVRAVRGSPYVKSNSFAVKNDETVLDLETHLTWQVETQGPMTWKEALLYCQNLSLSGFNDWRLPSVNELSSIVDLSRYSPAINDSIFTHTQSDYYWTSTTTDFSGYGAWSVHFSDGDRTIYGSSENNGIGYKSSAHYIRSVRGGLHSSFDNLSNWAFKELSFLPNYSLYALSESAIFRSKSIRDLGSFVLQKQINSYINAISSNILNTSIVVGNNSKVILLQSKSNNIDTLPVSVDKNLLDVTTNGIDFIIVGEQGTILKYSNGVILYESSNTTEDIVAVKYDIESNNYYAVSSAGELLSSPYHGNTWYVNKITNIPLTGIHKHEDIFVLTGVSGYILVSSDGSNFVKIQIQNNSDEFIAINYINDRFVLATSHALFTSKDGHNWIKDNTDFGDSNITGLHPLNDILYVLTDKGIRKISKFNNIQSGTTKTLSLVGVKVKFEHSTIEFENNNIKAMNIVPNDTMYIVKDDKNIAKIILGSNAALELIDKNTSTLESILDKNLEYFELTGSNVLYYNTGNNQYIPVSSGEFWIKDYKVQEKPLLQQISDNTESQLNEKIDAFITNSYSIQFNESNEITQRNMIKPDDMKQILKELVSFAKQTHSFDLPLTANDLLLGDLNKPFSPIYISSPFFRRLYLNTETNEIVLDKNYFFGPAFLAEGIQRLLGLADSNQALLSLPVLEYKVEGNRLEGSIRHFEMNLGPFVFKSDKATIKSSITGSSSTDEIIIDDAAFSLKTINNQFIHDGVIGTNVSQLKLAYENNNFKLISGEVGAELKIPNIPISPTWSVEDLTTSVDLIFREKYTFTDLKFGEKNTGGHRLVYKDEYPDNLDDFIVKISGSGKLDYKSNASGFSIEAGLSLVFDKNSLNPDTPDQKNLFNVDIKTKDWFSFPKAGVLTFNGVGGGYQYNKYGPSYWKMGAGFKLYEVLPPWSMFSGWAEIVTDTDMSNLGIGVKELITPIPATSLNFSWMANDGGVCLLFGQIQHNNPTPCPDIINCTDEVFKLKPSDTDEIFNGFGLGVQASLSLMDGDEVYSIADTVKFEEIIKGAVGATYYGVNDSQKEINLVAKVQLQLPKIDSRFVPSDWREGKPLGLACISVDYFSITEEIDGWFSDESLALGRHLGVYAKFGMNNENVVFIPFTNLRDSDDERIFFLCPNYQEEFTIESTKRSKLSEGDMIHHSFAVAKDQSRIIIDLSSSDNAVVLTLPDNTTITENSPDSEQREIKTSQGKYTVIYLYEPLSGIYNLSYKHTGNEHASLFGSNSPPQATITIDGNTINWSITDEEKDQVDYRLALVDDLEQPVINLSNASISYTSQSKINKYVIETISHIKTGDYKAAIYFTDNLNPLEYRTSEQTIHLEKSISTPENLTTLTTNDFVYLQWNSASGADAYSVSIFSNDQLIYQFETRSSHMTISDLMDGSYKAAVAAYDNEGFSGEKAMIEFNMNREFSNIIPQAVENIQTDFSEQSITISWNIVKDAYFYRVTLKHGQHFIYDNTITANSWIPVDNKYMGARMTISIYAVNKQNNLSEILTKQINLFDDIDSDNDSLPDAWERRYFSILNHTETEDYDLDGLTNHQELLLKTDPSAKDTDNDKIDDKNDPNPTVSSDRNLNTLPDDWELYYEITDIMADDDNDGYKNYIEYLADLNPKKADKASIDTSAYEAIDFVPIINANIDAISIVKINAPISIDLSSSFDINGDPLSFEWKINTESILSNASHITLDTSKTGMYRIEVMTKDSNNSVYRKYSIFVTDGNDHRIEAGNDHTIHLDNFEMMFPTASMKPDSYCVAADISQKNMPVKIMGIEIISDGLVYFYSDSYRMESPITITPYLKDDNEIDPYIFNYSTSIWTNINTGETFEPIMKKRTTPNTDKSYTICTKETGILMFAKRPQEAALETVTNLNILNKVYFVDLDTLKLKNMIKSIDDIVISDPDIVKIYKGIVSGKEELRLEVLKPGTTSIIFKGTDYYGNTGTKTYLIDVLLAKTDNHLLNILAALQTCSGMETQYDLSDYDFNHDGKIGLAESIRLLQKILQ